MRKLPAGLRGSTAQHMKGRSPAFAHTMGASGKPSPTRLRACELTHARARTRKITSAHDVPRRAHALTLWTEPCSSVTLVLPARWWRSSTF
jgi:hypothetical protein